MNAVDAIGQRYDPPVGEDTARAQAPGRVNLIGEHTDYNQGFVLPLAIGYGCEATLSLGTGDTVTIRSAQRPDVAEVSVADLVPAATWIAGDLGWAAYSLGVLWVLAERGYLNGPVPPVHVELDSSVPIRAGLSSSAALSCSTVTAADALFGLGLTSAERAAVATAAETDFVGAPTGGMDQLVSIYAQRGHVLFCDMRDLHTELVAFDPAAAGLELLVVDSCAPHRLVDGEYRARRQACEQAARQLGVAALRDIGPGELADALARLPDEVLRRRTRHVVTEDARVLATVEALREGRIREIGPLLTASHASMRDDFEITVDEIDVAVETVLAHGALGARMTGGGFGGCIIALIEAGRGDYYGEQVTRAYAARDFRPPRWFVAHPGAGAQIF